MLFNHKDPIENWLKVFFPPKSFLSRHFIQFDSHEKTFSSIKHFFRIFSIIFFEWLNSREQITHFCSRIMRLIHTFSLLQHEIMKAKKFSQIFENCFCFCQAYITNFRELFFHVQVTNFQKLFLFSFMSKSP